MTLMPTIIRLRQNAQQAGNPNANRSLVVREAILRPQESLKEQTPDTILKDFIAHQAKRAQQE
jgi:hypothetical protein